MGLALPLLAILLPTERQSQSVTLMRMRSRLSLPILISQASAMLPTLVQWTAL